MKKLIQYLKEKKRALTILFLMTTFYAYAGNADTTIKLDPKQYDTIKKKIDTVNKSVKVVMDTINSKAKMLTEKCVVCKDAQPKGGDWVLIFLPAFIFLLLFFILLRSLKNFDFKGAMSESEYPKITKENLQYNTGNLDILKSNASLAQILPPTIDVSDTPPAGTPKSPIPSISRYIAFITSILTVVIGLCMSCFFIYNYIRTGCAPDLSNLSTVLLALGIGVVPYAFNKVSTAIAKNKSE